MLLGKERKNTDREQILVRMQEILDKILRKSELTLTIKDSGVPNTVTHDSTYNITVPSPVYISPSYKTYKYLKLAAAASDPYEQDKLQEILTSLMN